MWCGKGNGHDGLGGVAPSREVLEWKLRIMALISSQITHRYSRTNNKCKLDTLTSLLRSLTCLFESGSVEGRTQSQHIWDMNDSNRTKKTWGQTVSLASNCAQ